MSWNSPIALWIVRVLVAIAVLVVGFWLARRVENGVKRFFEKTKVDPTLIRFSASAARWAFLVLIVISCLGALGLRKRY